MLLKSKVAALFTLGGKSQKSYCEKSGKSRQAFSQMMDRESLTLKELVNIADFLDLKVVVYNEHGQIDFIPSDFSPKVDNRKVFHPRKSKVDRI